jgi:hypothetical protein
MSVEKLDHFEGLDDTHDTVGLFAVATSRTDPYVATGFPALTDSAVSLVMRGNLDDTHDTLTLEGDEHQSTVVVDPPVDPWEPPAPSFVSAWARGCNVILQPGIMR